MWWPTESDLTAIRGIPYNEALVLSKRWPSSAVMATEAYSGAGVAGSSQSNAAGTATFTASPGSAP